jgi:acetyl esterase/lipase
LSDSGDLPASGARAGLAETFLRLAMRIGLRPVLSPSVPIPWQRRWLRLVARLNRPNGRVDIASGAVGGIKGEWVRMRGAAAPAHKRAAVLYLHGGAYCVGSPATHRAVTANLARATELPVFAVDYRLAPEHPFPAALEDCIAAYRALIESRPVVIAGDSAGAGLSLATALAAQRQQLRAAAALVLFSPWVDLTMSVSPKTAARSDALLSAGWLRACAHHYLGSTDATAPLASPLYGDLRGLPPALIQTGADELLRCDARRLHEALRDAGVAVRCEVVPGCWHDFQLLAGLLPSADAAIERAAKFIVLNLGS